LPDALPPPKLSVMTYGPVPELYVKEKQNVEFSCSIDSAYLKPQDYVTHPIHTYTVTLNCFIIITLQILFLEHKQQFSLQ